MSSDTVYIGYTLPTVRVENVFDQVAKSTATRFKALADPTRLRILKFLSCQEMYTWQIAEYVGVAQPTATEHLRILREAGFVTSRKQGSFVFYRTDSNAIKRACARLTEIIG
jgi:ArsR family transcriptional regulator